MISVFLETAIATNCALIDNDHPENLEKAETLLAGNPDRIRQDFVAACVAGEADAVRAALSTNPAVAVQPAGPRDWPPLLYVCFSRLLRSTDLQRQQGLVRNAELLLKSGADPNSFFMLGDEKETCLYGACGVANHAPLAAVLLEHGADVNDEDASYHVAEFERHDCIRVLFEHGMDARRRATVLLRKLDFEDVEGVRVILECGTDPNETGIWNKSALHQAIMRGRSTEMVRLLIDNGADVNQPRGDGALPWFLAARFSRPDLMQILEGAGADLTLQPDQRLIPAIGTGDRFAARKILQDDPAAAAQLIESDPHLICDLAGANNPDGLELAIEIGYPVDTADGQGFTALHWAAWKGCLDSIRMLVKHGAPLEAKNNYGGTVLDGAVWGMVHSNGNVSAFQPTIRLLVELGADLQAISPWPTGNRDIDRLLRELGR